MFLELFFTHAYQIEIASRCSAPRTRGYGASNCCITSRTQLKQFGAAVLTTQRPGSSILVTTGKAHNPEHRLSVSGEIH